MTMSIENMVDILSEDRSTCTGTYINRSNHHRLWTKLDDKSWYCHSFTPDNSNIKNLKEYDEIEYKTIGNGGIEIIKSIRQNREIDKYLL